VITCSPPRHAVTLRCSLLLRGALLGARDRSARALHPGDHAGAGSYTQLIYIYITAPITLLFPSRQSTRAKPDSNHPCGYLSQRSRQLYIVSHQITSASAPSSRYSPLHYDCLFELDNATLLFYCDPFLDTLLLFLFNPFASWFGPWRLSTVLNKPVAWMQSQVPHPPNPFQASATGRKRGLVNDERPRDLSPCPFQTHNQAHVANQAARSPMAQPEI
jgi:hypothetical protein